MTKDAPDILIFPPLASLIAPLAAVALEFLLPLDFLPPFGTLSSVVIGVVFLATSGWLAVAGSRAFKRANTNVDPRKPALVLVQEGPFQFTRNPMYLGMVLLQVGLAFTFSLDWALLLAPVLWAVLHYGVVLREEAYLTDKFGDDYREFLGETRRWI